MKFKYSAIGKNTAENREWLEKLGKRMQIGYERENKHPILQIWNSTDIVFTRFTYQVTDKDKEKYNIIDCTHSDALFQAVTAIREDSDMWQYFISGNGYLKLSRYHIFEYHAYISGCKHEKFRKATLEELQEHFTNKR